MTRLADEWAEDGYGDGSYVPSDTPDDEPLDDEAAQGGGPHGPDPEPEPPRHLVEDVQQNDGRTLCCERDMWDVLAVGGLLTDEPEYVTCPDTVHGPSGTAPGYSDEYEPERGSEVARADVLDVDTPRVPDADEIARSMAAYARAVRDESREHAEHTDGNPRFDPEQGVICGCGEVVDEGPDGTGYKPMGSPENLPAVTAADPVLSDLPPLDPHLNYTPADLERAILEQVRRLDAGLAMEAQWIEVYRRALWAHDKAAARARLRVKGGAKDVRDAEVQVACEREADDLAEARMRCEVIKASMHSLRSVLSGLQSVGRSVGVLVQAGGGDGQAPYRNRPPQQGRQSGPLL